MTPQSPRKAQQADKGWLSPVLLAIGGAVSFIVTVAPASLAAAAECQIIEDGGMVQDMPTWKRSTPNIPPLTITVERDIYRGLVPSPVREVAPYMRSNRIGWGNTENQEIATIGACLSQDIPKSARFNQSLTASVSRMHPNAQKPVMKFLARPYNGKRQVLTIRTTPPEIGISVPYKTPTMIGPVQEIQTPTLSDERSAGQSVAARTFTVESLPLSGSQPFDVLRPFQNALQLPDDDSHRMNVTTTRILHDGNCGIGCP